MKTLKDNPKLMQMAIGYLHGYRCLPNYDDSAAYMHGYRHGEHDRKGGDRKQAEVLRRRAEMILRKPRRLHD